MSKIFLDSLTLAMKARGRGKGREAKGSEGKKKEGDREGRKRKEKGNGWTWGKGLLYGSWGRWTRLGGCQIRNAQKSMMLLQNTKMSCRKVCYVLP